MSTTDARISFAIIAALSALVVVLTVGWVTTYKDKADSETRNIQMSIYIDSLVDDLQEAQLDRDTCKNKANGLQGEIDNLHRELDMMNSDTGEAELIGQGIFQGAAYIPGLAGLK